MFLLNILYRSQIGKRLMGTVEVMFYKPLGWLAADIFRIKR